MKPFISVLIPVYNQEELICKAIDSIPLRDDIEIIVANDCSTDNTLKSLLSLDRKIILLNLKSRLNIGEVRNILVEMAKGDWVVWLDSDDSFKPEISKVFELLNDSYDIVTLKGIQNDGRVRYMGQKYSCAMWLNIMKKWIYEKISFDNVECGEDQLFQNKLKKLNLKILHSNILAYNYNFPREGSLAWYLHKH